MTRSLRLKLRRAKHPRPPLAALSDLRCPSRKFSFRTAEAAEAAVEHLAAQGRDVAAYHCRHCGWYHLTHRRAFS